jgi:hypothetical protein
MHLELGECSVRDFLPSSEAWLQKSSNCFRLRILRYVSSRSNKLKDRAYKRSVYNQEIQRFKMLLSESKKVIKVNVFAKSKDSALVLDESSKAYLSEQQLVFIVFSPLES